MATYAPASSVGWLDLDAGASERVAAFIRSLEEPGTLDVLGLGTIRDQLSDLLSPGTSTIQTRLRYFMFLPWIFRRLESERLDAPDFLTRLRTYEVRLIDCLVNVGPNQGVIGFTARGKLKRMPSEAYWGGLGAWKIRRRDLSIQQYAHHARVLEGLKRDDDGGSLGLSRPMWARVPDPPAEFLDEDIDFQLTQQESDFLADQVRRHHPDTLLGVFAQTSLPFADIAFPWHLPTQHMPQVLLEHLHHAQCFSELTLGAQCTYNIMLAEVARQELHWDTDETEEQQRQVMSDWADLINRRRSELQAWVDDLDSFWTVVGAAAIHERTKIFVAEMAHKALSDPVGYADDDTVRGRVRDREILLKSKRARLGHRSALQAWNGDPLGGQFSFRWGTTRTYLGDLAASSEPVV